MESVTKKNEYCAILSHLSHSCHSGKILFISSYFVKFFIDDGACFLYSLSSYCSSHEESLQAL